MPPIAVPPRAATALEKLQQLLRTLFQLELSDLDFGIYRLLRLKRGEIEAFLTEQLPRRVEEAFQETAAGESTHLERQLEAKADEIRRTLGAEALDADGSIAANYAGTPLARAYEALRARRVSAEVSEAWREEVFNHLYNFFSRYYEDGDFVPRRHFGNRPRYAVPYNGEETFFHWANRGQHYVKSGEVFRDYAFSVDAGLDGEYRVRFALREASVAPGDTKGDQRYFFPQPAQLEYDDAARTLTLPFHYRLPTEAEQARYGRGARAQEAILTEALEPILTAVAADALAAALRRGDGEREGDAADEPPPLLLRRLRHFARRRTSDYFVHRDLKGFLTGELEFFLKDQVLHLADLDGDLPARLRVLRTVRRLADEIIEFLHQLEEVQRRLFQKRKFVLRTDWLVLVHAVPRALWPEVLDNPAQREAWRELFAVDPADLDEAFLEAHPTLVVDTRHFGADFTDRLLEGVDGDLDDETGGLLIHSENYQALRLLEPKYAGRVKCIYIDPPYNSGATEILYKNGYRHSSWLSLLSERMIRGDALLSGERTSVVAIDENELVYLGAFLHEHYHAKEITPIAVVHNPRGIQGQNFSYSHEYAYFIYPRGGRSIHPFPVPQDQWQYTPLRNWGGQSERADGRSLFYPIFVVNGAITDVGEPAPDGFHPSAQAIQRADGTTEVWPIDLGGVERKWRYSRETLRTLLHATRVVSRPDEIQVQIARTAEIPRAHPETAGLPSFPQSI